MYSAHVLCNRQYCIGQCVYLAEFVLVVLVMHDHRNDQISALASRSLAQQRVLSLRHVRFHAESCNARLETEPLVARLLRARHHLLRGSAGRLRERD